MWPTPQDYNESVQQPQICFSDLELRKCRVELNHLGLPRTMTGAFASVYRLSNLSGTSWAVRCFLEHREDIKERYTAVRSAVAASAANDLFANFDYIERGIKIKNDWYPILKMEWIDGDSLDQYLDRHVKTRAKVVNLHKQFRDMVEKLKTSGIAHGDLQHDNILVTDTGLRLIDYDDMFVQAISGKVSHELGHRNYQHPSRSHEHFSADLDNYSTWVIDLSLKALVVDPEIWRDFNGGDDCLLFRYKDFTEPDESPLLKALTTHLQSDLRESALLFRDVLRLNPGRTPEYHSDRREVEKLLHLESVEVITESERKEYNEKKEETKETKETSADPFEMSFVDYDRWLASINQQPQPGKKTRKALEKAKENSASLGKKIWRELVSHVAPFAWARGVVDEANREYDEGNITEAVKLYTDAVSVLTPHDDFKYRARDERGLQSAVLLCEILVNLGYCSVQKQQLGTAAHYFSESQKRASPNLELGQAKLQATLLLAATYFELDQRERAFRSIKEVAESTEVLMVAVRGEREGPFGTSLTLPAMLTELGHNYLTASEFPNAEAAYLAAMEACQWIKDERETLRANLIIARAASGFCSSKIAQDETEEAIKQFFELVDVEAQVDLFQQLVRAEMRGPLKTYWKFGELMRLLGHELEARGNREQARLAYTASLTVMRLCNDGNALQMKIADCLIGLGKSLEAVAVIRDGSDWTKGHSPYLSEQIRLIEDFSHALVVSTVVFDDDIQKHRYRCLDALVNSCPGIEIFDSAILDLELTELGAKLAFAELMLELARDLKRIGRERVAKSAYAAAFRAFKKTTTDSAYGSSIMECLLAMGDLDIAANLLLEGGRLEEMVRLMVSVMISQQNYNRGSICELMARVADTQMARPPASVTEAEVRQTIDLLLWCAGEDVELIESTRQRAERWLANREVAFAHNLVEQGKFAEAIELFEKHEGTDGGNALQVQEILILRYLSSALIDRDRAYVTVADGYAFGCAIDRLKGMRDKNVLTPTFAAKVAELIRSTRIVGAERYVEDVYTIFLGCGRGFENAVLSLRDMLTPISRNMIEKRLNIKGNEDVVISISDGQFELEIRSPEQIAQSPPPMSTEDGGIDSWRQMHRTFFLIDREDYAGAIEELGRRIEASQEDSFRCDAILLRGYCQFLLQDNVGAEHSFKQAIYATSRNDRVRHTKMAVCIYLIFSRTRDKARYLRQLVDPTLTQKDLFKLATQLAGITMNERDDLADYMALELMKTAEKGEKTSLTAPKMYRAALAILGLKNQRRQLQIIFALDAIGKYRGASIVLKQHIDKDGIYDDTNELLAKLARRHIRVVATDWISHLYKSAGVNFQKYIQEAEEDLTLSNLSKVLDGTVPKRLLMDVRHDLIGYYGRGRLSPQLCVRISRIIAEGILEDPTGERRDRFYNDLIGIARVVEKADAASCASITQVLEASAKESSAGGSNPLDDELFPMVADKN
ncbi:MAG: hypothetical protein SGJ27_25305 [Candidatus Melainabacteria bacterium]|nr:hypothetical protein [Candidatus Melainabacteria bacterium]